MIVTALPMGIACSPSSADTALPPSAPASIIVEQPVALGGGTVSTQLATSAQPKKRHHYGLPLPLPNAVSSPAVPDVNELSSPICFC
jgi:hypothetical protein